MRVGAFTHYSGRSDSELDTAIGKAMGDFIVLSAHSQKSIFTSTWAKTSRNFESTCPSIAHRALAKSMGCGPSEKRSAHHQTERHQTIQATKF